MKLLKSQNYQTKIKNAWLYIFCQGYLWRECYINHNSHFIEVDLAKTFAQDRRVASGLPNPMLLLIKDGQSAELDLEFAVAETQWSWQRVYYYGGLASDDPRNKVASQCSQVSRDEYQFRRQQRFVTLTFKDSEVTVKQSSHDSASYYATPPYLLAPVVALPHPSQLLTNAVADFNRLTEQRYPASLLFWLQQAMVDMLESKVDCCQVITQQLLDYFALCACDYSLGFIKLGTLLAMSTRRFSEIKNRDPPGYACFSRVTSPAHPFYKACFKQATLKIPGRGDFDAQAFEKCWQANFPEQNYYILKQRAHALKKVIALYRRVKHLLNE